MAKHILPSEGNQIDGIAVWEQKDRYPVVSAGSVDPAQLATDEGTLNGNVIRFRNYMNTLRALFDAGLNALQDASEAAAGKVSTAIQSFAGLKTFVDGIASGKSEAKDAVYKFFLAANAFVTVLKASHTANRSLYLPDKDGTLATTDDVAAKQDAMTDQTAIEVASVDSAGFVKGTVLQAKGTNGKVISVIAGTPTADRTVTIEDKSGKVPVIAADKTLATALQGAGLYVNEDGTLTPYVDNDTLNINGDGKLCLMTIRRRQMYLVGTPGVNGYLIFNGFQTTQNIGFPLPEAGCITRICYMLTDGSIGGFTLPYSLTSPSRFAAGTNHVTIQAAAASKDFTTYLNNYPVEQLSENGAAKTVVMAWIEITLDV